jgi:prepilin-type N-terminal cleavage/methylation domain-containing protein/prepilin-type processing-associated H-X9-DG protein
MKKAAIRNISGFTIVELLVVIVIIVVLASLSFLGYSRMRAVGDRAATVAIMRQLQAANYAYATEHGGQFVPLQSKDENGAVSVTWHQNSAFLACLTGDESALTRNELINNSPPLSILDPIVVRSKKRLWNKLFASYGYNQENMPTFGRSFDKSFRIGQITNGARSAAFVSGTDHYLKYSGRLLWTKTSVEGKSTDGRMAFRHDGKAIVVYYDGSSGFITQADIKAYDRKGGLANPFWKADY